MKTTANWLNELCPANLSVEQIVTILMRAGFEVESVDALDGDALLSLEITANHADWLGAIGIAREIAAVTGIPACLPPSNLIEEGEPIEKLTSVDVLDFELCPLYIARVVTGVKIGESPQWLQNRLKNIGLRPVNAVVDVTNYLMYETGQPLHAFDLNKLEEKRIVVRASNKGEKMIAINGKELALDGKVTVIADAEKPVAIAGVMGGLYSEISSDTTDILIECAAFNGPATRRATRAVGITSDSSARFERGTDIDNADYVSRRCAELILQYCGGKAAKGAITESAPRLGRKTVFVRPSRIEHLLGIYIEPEKVLSILTNLGFKVIESEEDRITVEVPSWRKDISREVDLIEEVARITGFEKIPDSVNLRVWADPIPESYLKRRKLRSILSGLGLNETIIDPFIEPHINAEFRFISSAKIVTLMNPPRADMNSLRTSLVPGMLKVLKGNRDRNITNVNIFEIERIYMDSPSDLNHPTEVELVGMLSEGSFYDLKGIIEAAFDAFLPKASRIFQPSSRPHIAQGKCVELFVNGEVVGYLGELSAKHADLLDLKVAPVVAEFLAEKLYAASGLPLRSFDNSRIPRFPSVERDFAFVLDESVQWSAIEAAVLRSAASIPIEEIKFFDVYRGKQVEAGKKSVALRVVFRSPDATLTESQITSACDAIVSEMANRFSATLRGK